MLENNPDVVVRLLEENQRLLQANHEELKKLNKRARVEFWIRIAIYAAVFFLPLLLIPYLLSGISALTGTASTMGISANNQTDTAAIIKQLQELTR
jgi:hypothetical protein